MCIQVKKTTLFFNRKSNIICVTKMLQQIPEKIYTKNKMRVSQNETLDFLEYFKARLPFTIIRCGADLEDGEGFTE